MQNSNTPLVSIICTVYNHEPYLRQCLDGFVMQQTNFPFEIIIHDDASTDESAKIISEYADKYPDLFVPILQKENQYSKGVKIGITFMYPIAKGKYIAECEGDDYWTDPLKLQKQVDFLEFHPDYTAAIHNAERQANGRLINRYDILPENGLITPEMAILGGGDFCATNSIVFRKMAIDTAPKEVFSQFVGDYPLQMYLTFTGNVYYFKDVMSVYRVNAIGSWSQSHMQPDIDIRKTVWRKEAKLYRDMDRISGGKYRRTFHKKKYESLLWDAKRCGSWYYALFFWIMLGAPLDHIKANYFKKFMQHIIKK